MEAGNISHRFQITYLDASKRGYVRSRYLVVGSKDAIDKNLPQIQFSLKNLMEATCRSYSKDGQDIKEVKAIDTAQGIIDKICDEFKLRISNGR